MKIQLFDFSQLQKIDKLYFGQHGRTDNHVENKQKKKLREKKKSNNENYSNENKTATC